jgi:hypothetical protein
LGEGEVRDLANLTVGCSLNMPRSIFSCSIFDFSGICIPLAVDVSPPSVLIPTDELWTSDSVYSALSPFALVDPSPASAAPFESIITAPSSVLSFF